MSEFDNYADSYHALLRDPLRDGFSPDRNFFHRRKWELIREFFLGRQQDTRHMDWLDVGCGQGELLELGASAFRTAAGCDPSCRMLTGTAKPGGRAIELKLQTHPTTLPFPDQSFDLVTAVCVYHHVHGYDRTLLTESIQRVLRPQGIFCLIEHNPWNPLTRLIVSRCPVDVDAELISAPAAVQLLRRSQLKPIQTSYVLYFPEGIYRRLGKIERSPKEVPAGGQYAIFNSLERRSKQRESSPVTTTALNAARERAAAASAGMAVGSKADGR